MRNSETFEKSGLFWLPSSPKDKVPGNLIIKDSGDINLEILGVISDLDDDNSTIRINGIIEGNKYITLDECFYLNRNNMPKNLVSKSIIYAQAAYFDVHFGENEEIQFSSLKFSVEGLDEWLSISGIDIKYDFKTGSGSVDYKPLEKISIKLNKYFDLFFSFELSAISLGQVVTETKISQKAYINIVSKKLLPFSVFRSLTFKINNFLCFAIDDTVTIDSVTAYSNEIRSANHGYEVPIQIYYLSLPDTDQKPTISSHRMLFRYKDISDNLQKILVKWLDAYEHFEPAFNLYFASKSDRNGYLELKFLSLTQGIETLHRRKSNETVMPDDEFKYLVKLLGGACPDNKREWLENKLIYANELSLRKRLKQLLDPFNPFFGNGKNRKALIDKIVNTRNYLTHYDDSLKRKACKGEELRKICDKMECLFQLQFLKEINFSDPEIQNFVKDNRKFKYKMGIFKS